MRRDAFVAILLAWIVVFPALTLGVGVGAGTSGTFDSDDSLTAWNGKTTDFTASMFTARGGFEPTDRVVTHGAGLPGWYISYDADDADAYANVDDWVNSSDDRVELDHDADSGRVLVAAPAEHIRRTSLGGLSTDGLVTRAWVESIEIEQRVDVVEPVSLESRDQVDDPTRRARTLAAIGGGAFANDDDGADGVAFDGENKTDLAEVKQSIAADSSSIPSTADGSSVTIAVLDTGANVGTGSDRGLVFGNGSIGSPIRIAHGKNFVTGESINTSVDSTNRSYDAIADGNLHGTYTAARIAGAAGGNDSIAGPASESTLAIGKVLADDGGGSIQQIIDGLEWACSDEVDADVVSMSLGSPRYSEALESEIHECLADDDVSAITVAAGNSRWSTGRTNIGSPADADGVISVAATTTDGPADVESAYFSNVGPDDGIKDGSGSYTRGDRPDVGSPGMANTVFMIDSSGSTTSKTLSGTSMSTPDVAAASALVVDENPDLRGDHEAVRERILETASPAPKIGVTEIGHGLLNVSRALDDDRPTEDQDEARTEQAKARDAANQALAGRLASFLKSRGLDV